MEYITFIDHVGRTVVGKLTTRTENTFTVNNPVILHVQPNAGTGQLQVQSFPYIFAEFIDPASRDKNEWTFNTGNTVISNVTLDKRIISQYENINKIPEPQKEPEVIKLFDN